MAVTYVAPNFSVDAVSTNIAGLEAVKGSAIATTDNIYCFNNGICDIEKTCAFNYGYINDNPAGSAVTKAGRITSSTGGITITLHDATLNGGLTGKTGTGAGYYSLVGSAGSPITIVSNTANKVSLYNVNACPNVFKYCQMTSWNALTLGNALNVVENCNLSGCLTYGIIFYAASNSSFLDNSLTDYAAGCYIVYISGSVYPTLLTLQSWLNNLAFIRTATAANFMSYLNTAIPVGTTYLQLTEATTPTVTQLDRIDQFVQLIFAMLNKGKR